MKVITLMPQRTRRKLKPGEKSYTNNVERKKLRKKGLYH